VRAAARNISIYHRPKKVICEIYDDRGGVLRCSAHYTCIYLYIHGTCPLSALGVHSLLSLEHDTLQPAHITAGQFMGELSLAQSRWLFPRPRCVAHKLYGLLNVTVYTYIYTRPLRHGYGTSPTKRVESVWC